MQQYRQQQFPRPSFTLVVILVSMLVMGFWVYQTPERPVRPQSGRQGEPSSHSVNARSLVQRIGQTQGQLIKEASALCKSRKHPGIYWTLCDSGNLPFLFAIEANGRLRATIRIEGAQNVDWEALAMDEEGRLYVGDIGNNDQKLKTRSIYRLEEPELLDAKSSHEPQTVRITGRWEYTFPGKPFDAESLIVRDHAFWIISKVKKVGETRLYRVPMGEDGATQAIQEVAKLPGEVSMIADASLHSDGKHLAVVNQFYTAVFPLAGGRISDACTTEPTIYEYDLFKVEGCAWEGDELILIAEDRKIYRLPLHQAGQ